MKKLVIAIVIAAVAVAIGIGLKNHVEADVVYEHEFHPSDYSDTTVLAHTLLDWYDQTGVTEAVRQDNLEAVVTDSGVVELYDHEEGKLLGALFSDEKGYDDLIGYTDEVVETYLSQFE